MTSWFKGQHSLTEPRQPAHFFNASSRSSFSCSLPFSGWFSSWELNGCLSARPTGQTISESCSVSKTSSLAIGHSARFHWDWTTLVMCSSLIQSPKPHKACPSGLDMQGLHEKQELGLSHPNFMAPPNEGDEMEAREAACNIHFTSG